jgi:hypothetical protein
MLASVAAPVVGDKSPLRSKPLNERNLISFNNQTKARVSRPVGQRPAVASPSLSGKRRTNRVFMLVYQKKSVFRWPCYVAVGLHFVRVDGYLHVVGRQKIVARLDHRWRKQCAHLPDRHQDLTVWFRSSESLLYRSVFIQCSELEKGTAQQARDSSCAGPG